MRGTLLLAHVTVNKMFLKHQTRYSLGPNATCLVVLTVFNSLSRIDSGKQNRR